MSPAGSFGLSYNARRADRQWSFAPVAASYAISPLTSLLSFCGHQTVKSKHHSRPPVFHEMERP